MFALDTGTIDHELERAEADARRELGEISAIEARNKQRVTEIVRGVADRRDWERAGDASIAEWFAKAYRTDYATAVRITRASEALRVLPAIDHALSTGALSLDQVTAAVQFATPETDAHLALVAVGKAPSEISRVARIAAPPVVADDQELYKRRALSMTWTQGHRELVLHGRLPLEQGLAFEQAIWSIAKEQRAADKKDGVELGWQQSAADALVTLAHQAGDAARGEGEGEGVRRDTATLIVHVSEDEPPILEGAGPISIETAERLTCTARRMLIKLSGHDLVHSRVERCGTYPQIRALHKRSKHCQYPGCTRAREVKGHHLWHEARGGKAVIDNLILLCNRHHTLVHDHHIHTTGPGIAPIFTDQNGRLITTTQPHAPPRQE